MDTHLSIQELEALYGKLLQSLHSINKENASPEIPETIVRAYRTSPFTFGNEGIYPDLQACYQQVMNSGKAVRTAELSARIEGLKKIKKEHLPVLIETSCGLCEYMAPVLLGDTCVFLLSTGKYLPPQHQKRFEMFCDEHQLPDEIRDTATAAVTPDDVMTALLDNISVITHKHLDETLANTALTTQIIESERTRSLGSLSSGVAHHFNNLLSVILGYASHAINKHDLSEEALNAVRQISEAAQKGRRLTEEILSFADQDRNVEKECELHSIINNVVSLLQTQTPSSLRITLLLNADNDRVLAPTSDLHQVIFNLLTNAIDSMPEGGDIMINTSSVTLGEEDSQESYIRLSVRDSASGAVSTRDDDSDDHEKLSLKLSSVYGIVGRMDGTMMISSDEHEHNQVEVLLPTTQPATSATAAQETRKKLASSHIWVVDDNPTFREMCHQVLEDDGHDVLELDSGRTMQEAWKKTDRKPDLFIIDFSMPEFNGLELCEWLQEQGSGAPVVLVSGFANSQPDIKKALKMKHVYFIQKPFTVPELADVVTVALGETLIGE